MGLDDIGRGLWEQTLIPPSSDPSFDFSGEHVNGFAAPPAGPDRCWLIRSGELPFDKIQNKPFEFWTVGSGNVYGPDAVGYGPVVLFYRKFNPILEGEGSCGTVFGQQMKIHAHSDPPNTYTAYGGTNTGNVNLLGASMIHITVTSERADMSVTKKWP